MSYSVTPHTPFRTGSNLASQEHYVDQASHTCLCLLNVLHCCPTVLWLHPLECWGYWLEPLHPAFFVFFVFNK